MGPYCRFCDQRCFIPMPAETPTHIRAAYGPGHSWIVATCPGGKRFEREKTGYCLDDIRAATTEAKSKADKPGPERLAKFLELDRGYPADEAERLVAKYPMVVALYIMRGDFALGAMAMAIEMKEDKQQGDRT